MQNDTIINELVESWENGNRTDVCRKVKRLSVIEIVKFVLELSENQRPIFIRMFGGTPECTTK